MCLICACFFVFVLLCLGEGPFFCVGWPGASPSEKRGGGSPSSRPSSRLREKGFFETRFPVSGKGVLSNLLVGSAEKGFPFRETNGFCVTFLVRLGETKGS